MRDTCIGCGALEDRNGPYCFWYDHPVDVDRKCGNDFTEKPEFTQEELEEIVYNPKYQVYPTEQLDKWAQEGEEGSEKIYQAVQEAQERFRQEKKSKGRT